MKRTIQKIIGFIALSIGLVSHEPVFAASDRLVEKQLDINEEFPWRIGIQLWKKAPIRMVAGRFSGGSEFALGPFVEWKPLNGLGIQTGVMYGYNGLSTAGFNWKKEIVDGWSGRHQPTSKNMPNNHSIPIDVDHVTFHAISIPLSIRFYPGSDREFAFHGGLRLIIPLSKAKQTCYGSLYVDSADTLSQWVNKTVEFISDQSGKVNAKSGLRLINDLEIEPHLTLDFGFDYNSKYGFIIGINGLGLALGYNCSKFWFK